MIPDWSTRALRILAAAVMMLASGSAGGQGRIAGRARAIDGNTIEIRGQRIRLFGIDAPDRDETCTDRTDAPDHCGERAADALDYRISDEVVTCLPKARDEDGVVAQCRAYGEDLSAWMAGLGWARALPGGPYGPAEALARRRKAGLWSGQFGPPSRWRADSRDGAEKANR